MCRRNVMFIVNEQVTEKKLSILVSNVRLEIIPDIARIDKLAYRGQRSNSIKGFKNL